MNVKEEEEKREQMRLLAQGKEMKWKMQLALLEEKVLQSHVDEFIERQREEGFLAQNIRHNVGNESAAMIVHQNDDNDSGFSAGMRYGGEMEERRKENFTEFDVQDNRMDDWGNIQKSILNQKDIELQQALQQVRCIYL